LVEWKPKYSHKALPRATLSITNLPLPVQGSNPSCRILNPTNNILSYDSYGSGVFCRAAPRMYNEDLRHLRELRGLLEMSVGR
jgi:hypothetical protein